ncbi:MAG: thioredoxin domain-containing protein [Acidobacteriota bacterium]
MAEHKFTNRLSSETSPYLLQHAHNPVDWYPWGEEALARAKDEDRPILLSVGYSACHWCHVMERESFENQEIAQMMNDRFVCVKVDREERPDLDQIYMNAVQLMTGHGGWPMTVFLTPEGVPFYGGTYFPPNDRYGMPGFPRILQAVAEAYHTKRDEIEVSGHELLNEIRNMNNFRPSGELLSVEILRKAYHNLASNFDSRNGGFGRAPKFPQPMNLNFLLRFYARTGSREALDMVETTLDYMARGGIYDHLGGAFARYSTDEKWLVPHFEKMLYDNALLSQVYLRAYQLTGKPMYRRITEETLDWVLAEMTDPQGGFYSTLDADSEGVEGKFYIWEKEEIEHLLGTDASAFINYYSVTSAGNFEEKNILYVAKPEDEMAKEAAKIAGISIEELHAALIRGRQTLLTARAQRIRPGRDDKILTAWNGMMIRSFAEAARVLGRDDYRAAAIKATEFLLSTNYVDGRLLRSYKDGQAKYNAYLEDYAYMIDALIALYEATGKLSWLEQARVFADVMIEQFWDNEDGGFFFTGKDHEELVARSKDYSDNATPSGNSVAIDVLLRLQIIFNHEDYGHKATRILSLLTRVLERFSAGFGHTLGALDFYLSTPKEIAIIGEQGAANTEALLATVYGHYLPNKVVVIAEANDTRAKELIPLLADRGMINGQATAYVCEKFTCKQPVNSPEELATQLGGYSRSA